MIDYDSFSRCHLTDIFFRFSRGSKRAILVLHNFLRRQLTSESDLEPSESARPTLFTSKRIALTPI